jgi:hypothetical protein
MADFIRTPGNRFRPSLPQGGILIQPATAAKSLRLGIELVEGAPGISFRVRKGGGCTKDGVIPNMDCPQWWKGANARTEALTAARMITRRVADQLRRLGYKVEVFEQ